MNAGRHVEAVPVPVPSILVMREDYRSEMNCQIVHDSWHARGFTDAYQLTLGDQVVGYGAIAGDPEGPREVIKEFYVVPGSRAHALPLFRELIAVSGARRIAAQTNDRLLTLLLFDCAQDITADAILFAGAGNTALSAPGTVLRRVSVEEHQRIFPHLREPVGEWGLECDGAVVATGGILLHYNPPYGDLFMEVAATHQRRGLGSYLVQELKRICHEMGRVPAARCRPDNNASRRTLERAGMLPCARILIGRVQPSSNVPTG